LDEHLDQHITQQVNQQLHGQFQQSKGSHMFILQQLSSHWDCHLSHLSFHFFIGIFTLLPFVTGICLGIVSHFPIYMSLGSYCRGIERAIGLAETLPDFVFSIYINK